MYVSCKRYRHRIYAGKKDKMAEEKKNSGTEITEDFDIDSLKFDEKGLIPAVVF